MKLPLVSFLICGLSMGSAWADTPPVSSGLPAPEGLKPCSSDDPVATLEARVAASLNGEFLGCFQSERTASPPGVVASARTPVEYAFAFALKGQDYKLADLDSLLSTV